MKLKYLLLLTLGLLAGCRHTHCCRHTAEKPKIKQKVTSRLESGTKLWAEGYGPNRTGPGRNPTPAECVDLRAILEYSLEW